MSSLRMDKMHLTAAIPFVATKIWKKNGLKINEFKNLFDVALLGIILSKIVNKVFDAFEGLVLLVDVLASTQI